MGLLRPGATDPVRRSPPATPRTGFRVTPRNKKGPPCGGPGERRLQLGFVRR
jgi:hypothetical protein